MMYPKTKQGQESPVLRPWRPTSGDTVALHAFGLEREPRPNNVGNVHSSKQL